MKMTRLIRPFVLRCVVYNLGESIRYAHTELDRKGGRCKAPLAGAFPASQGCARPRVRRPRHGEYHHAGRQPRRAKGTAALLRGEGEVRLHRPALQHGQ